MPDAFMKRSAERQQFLEEMQSLLRKLDEESPGWIERRDEAYGYLSCQIIFYIHHDGKLSDHKGGLRHEIAARHFLRTTLLQAVEAFSRAEVEADCLLAELAIWLTKTALAEQQFRLTALEMEQPKLIFRAPTATAKVPMED